MKLLIPILSISLASSLVATAQDNSQQPVEQEISLNELKQTFPTAQDSGFGTIGIHAQIKVPEGLVFMSGTDGDKLLQSWGNLPSQFDGLIMPKDASWAITFDFDPVGYVKDDEKEDIDADEILENNQEAQKEANKQRVAQGLGELNILKWAVPPNYNTSTNNLEWAMLLEDSEGNQTINLETRLLGRHGVMSATLLCGPEQVEGLKPTLNTVLEGFEYKAGRKYGEYQEGDKVAEYGLLGLMGAGGAFVLWKFWKPISAGVVVFFVAVKKFAGRLFGSKQEG